MRFVLLALVSRLGSEHLLPIYQCSRSYLRLLDLLTLSMQYGARVAGSSRPYLQCSPQITLIAYFFNLTRRSGVSHCHSCSSPLLWVCVLAQIAPSKRVYNCRSSPLMRIRMCTPTRVCFPEIVQNACQDCSALHVYCSDHQRHSDRSACLPVRDGSSSRCASL